MTAEPTEVMGRDDVRVAAAERAAFRDGGLLRRAVAVVAVLGVCVHRWIPSLAGVGPGRLPGPSREAMRNAELTVVSISRSWSPAYCAAGMSQLMASAWLSPFSAMRQDAQNRAWLRPPSGVSATVRARASGRHPVADMPAGGRCGAGRGGSRNLRCSTASTGFGA